MSTGDYRNGWCGMNAGWRANLPGLFIWAMLILLPAGALLQRSGFSLSLLSHRGEEVFLRLESTAPALAEALLSLGFGGNLFLAIVSLLSLFVFGAILFFHARNSRKYPNASIASFFINMPIFLFSLVMFSVSSYLVSYFS